MWAETNPEKGKGDCRMTREEAIYLLNNLRSVAEGKEDEAIDVAIEALSERNIARDIATILENEQDMRVMLQNEVVRCKDCKWYKKIVEKSKSGLCHYDLVARCLHDEDYCSHGEKREEVNGFKSVGQAWNTSQGRWEP